MREIVVIGCGLAGYHAARRIEQRIAGRRRVRLTVINERADFVFSPLLTAVASGELLPGHITVGLSDVFESYTRVIVDRVERIDVDAGEVVTTQESLGFDYLVIATGTAPSATTFTGAGELIGPHSLKDAVEIRDRLDALEADGSGDARFAVVGASTTGVEWAARLASRAADGSGLNRTEVELYEVESRVLPDHSAQLADKVETLLEQLGVRVYTDCRIDSATVSQVVPEGEAGRDATMVFHCAGRVGTSPITTSGLPVDSTGRVEVNDQLGVVGNIGVYAAGDAIRGPSTAPSNTNPQIARQQGIRAARNLIAAMSGRTQEPFEYDDRGDFVMLGPGDTILQLGGMQLEGKAAWLAHRLFYTALMPQSLSKLRLLVDWVGRSAGSATSVGANRRLPDDS